VSGSEQAAEVVDLDPRLMLERIDAWVDGFVRLLPNIIVALLLLLVAWFAARALGGIIRRTAGRRDRENLGAVVGSFARWTAFILAALLAMTIVLPTLRPGDLIAGLGVTSIAIGFAFKDILQNWLAGILILIRQPFAVGDQIVVGEFEGTVDRIESRATLINTYDHQRVVIPNSDIYTSAVVVRTAFASRRSQYDVGIGYADDIDRVCALIVETVSELEGVDAEPPPEALPWSLDASWVSIRVRWWTASDRASVVRAMSQVVAAVKRALDAAGVDMPFETQVLLFHDQTEEVDGVRGHQREGWPAPADAAAPRPARERRAAHTGN
jgi:small-conductance mechanosensitive channel